VSALGRGGDSEGEVKGGGGSAGARMLMFMYVEDVFKFVCDMCEG